MTARSRRAGLAALATLVLMIQTVGVVAAAAPGNDAAASPTVIGGLPYGDAIDTTEATSQAVDPSTCVPNGHTVWYEFTAATTQDLRVDTFGSDFDTVVHVGTPAGGGGMDVLACVDDSGGTLQSAVRFGAEAGVTYLIAVGSFIDTPGGNLVIHLDVAPPPVEIALTIDGMGTFTPGGVARIGGTATCSAAVVFAGLEVRLQQRVGKIVIVGFGFSGLASCGPDPVHWSAEVISPDGKFLGGRATASALLTACGELECVETSSEATIQLRR